MLSDEEPWLVSISHHEPLLDPFREDIDQPVTQFLQYREAMRGLAALLEDASGFRPAKSMSYRSVAKGWPTPAVERTEPQTVRSAAAAPALASFLSRPLKPVVDLRLVEQCR